MLNSILKIIICELILALQVFLFVYFFVVYKFKVFNWFNIYC